MGGLLLPQMETHSQQYPGVFESFNFAKSQTLILRGSKSDWNMEKFLFLSPFPSINLCHSKFTRNSWFPLHVSILLLMICGNILGWKFTKFDTFHDDFIAPSNQNQKSLLSWSLSWSFISLISLWEVLRQVKGKGMCHPFLEPKNLL